MLITNVSEENSLLARLKNLIKGSEEMRVLVGFFYFWGIRELHEGLLENEDFRLKILVGLEAESKAGTIVEYAAHDNNSPSDKDSRDAFLKSLRSAMRSKGIDTQVFYERVGLFIDLLKAGRIEIRKTREPNHAKLYHFALNEAFAKTLDRKYCWITGSSNMTRPGLNEQHELNVQLIDFGGEESKQFFDALWEVAVPLTDDPETKERIIEMVGGDESLLAEVTPFEAYALVLKHYLEHREQVDRTPTIERVFASVEDEEGEPKYRALNFQIDAVNQALSILREYNGVIIADVVGLGKSVIASVLARVNAKRGLVIAPPGLVGDDLQRTGWWGYLQDFSLNDWSVYSRGMLEDVLASVNRQRDYEIVVIDEAHYFRNQDSEDYHYMSQICRGKQVVLLTATPYSNRPSDMLSLVKLFTPVRQSLLTPDGNLEAMFRVYQTKYRRIDYVLKHLEDVNRERRVAKELERLGIELVLRPGNYTLIREQVKAKLKRLAQAIRQVVEPVMIRRNRLDLRGDPDYAREIGDKLPVLHDPIEMFYRLSHSQSLFYDKVISDYFGDASEFSGTIYQPGSYAVQKAEEDGQDQDEEENGDGEATGSNQQRNMYKFIRRLLVRRFESSFGAFAKTISNLIEVHHRVKTFAQNPPVGRGVVVLDRSVMDKIMNLANPSDEEVDELLCSYENIMAADEANARRRNVQVYRLDTDFDKAGRKRFFADLDADIKLLERVRDEVQSLDLIANDPKAIQLVDQIRDVLNGRHANVESRANEPQRKVLIFTEFADTVLHLQKYLDDAFPSEVLTIRTLGKEAERMARLNFDAACNANLQLDRYKILLATDKMSEGFNLNRAGLVINYDIPWNPTRVIQRLGRINRIGTKVFETLYLFNYFPTEQGADQNNVRKIATTKMFMIHTSIGEDAKIFAVDEEPTAAGLYERLSESPEAREEEGFLTRAKREWLEICQNHPQLVEKLNKLPGRVKTARSADPHGVYLFSRKGMTLFALRHSTELEQEMGDGTTYLPISEAVDEIRCEYETPRSPKFSERFWPSYNELQNCLEQRREGATPGTTSLIVKARNALLGAIERGLGGAFARRLLEDLQNHGTLAERTLRKIAETAGDDIAFNQLMKQLKDEMGIDYLDRLITTNADNEIIVAIEHL